MTCKKKPVWETENHIKWKNRISFQPKMVITIKTNGEKNTTNFVKLKKKLFLVEGHRLKREKTKYLQSNNHKNQWILSATHFTRWSSHEITMTTRAAFSMKLYILIAHTGCIVFLLDTHKRTCGETGISFWPTYKLQAPPPPSVYIHGW